MNDFGALLYEGRTDSNKNSFGFFIIGVFLLSVSGVFYDKTFIIVVGVLFVLIGLYLFIFKRKESISIYEQAIILTLKGQAFIIDKEDIHEIQYHEVKARRSPVVNYYPVLVLKNEEQILLNKAFNSVVNKDFEKVIKSYS